MFPQVILNCYFQLFPYHVLSTRNQRLPKGVDRTRLEVSCSF